MENTEEQWKDIEGYEGLYQVSNLGRVKSLKCYGGVAERILKNTLRGENYECVHLFKDGNDKFLSVHRLVAQAFIPNPDNLSQVNHKDENKTNNCVNNLEWCDRKYNMNYGTRNKRVSKKLTNGKLSKEVIQCDLEGNEIARFPSTKEVQRQLGFLQSGISQCCVGKYNTAYGFKWRFA